MKRILIEIYLPAAQRTFDVWVPANARLSQVANLTAHTLESLCSSVYAIGTKPLICDRTTGEIHNINMTVWELGYRTGTKLMLI